MKCLTSNPYIKVHLNYKGYKGKKQGSGKMIQLLIASWLGSVVISIFIGNLVGSHYLKENDKKWEKTFDKAIKYLDQALKRRN